MRPFGICWLLAPRTASSPVLAEVLLCWLDRTPAWAGGVAGTLDAGDAAGSLDVGCVSIWTYPSSSAELSGNSWVSWLLIERDGKARSAGGRAASWRSPSRHVRKAADHKVSRSALFPLFLRGWRSLIHCQMINDGVQSHKTDVFEKTESTEAPSIITLELCMLNCNMI